MVCEADFPASRITAIRRPSKTAGSASADYEAMVAYKKAKRAAVQEKYDEYMAASVKKDA